MFQPAVPTYRRGVTIGSDAPARSHSAVRARLPRRRGRRARTALCERAGASLPIVTPLRYVGTAGWNIPSIHRSRFPSGGSQLQPYAARLNAAEINTSFYRPHAITTYERWAAVVPRSFRFAIKVPRIITHDRALVRVRDPLTR